jgi:hypothetical protein
MIPEAQNPVAKGFQSRASLGVVQPLFGMLPAIGLNDQHGFKAEKIYDVRIDNHLATELVACQAARPEMPPQQQLGIGGLLAQRAGMGLQ